MQSIDAIAHQINHKTGFGQTLLQVITGFRFVFNNQYSHGGDFA
jgi:hypothetical protein